jgi:hypothetical protein
VAATLRLVREGIGFELWRGKYDVTVDGQYSSPTRSFDVSDGDTANFRCHGANVWPRFVASLVKPDLAISLRRE